jgi:iron complex outermembrane receptor protein
MKLNIRASLDSRAHCWRRWATLNRRGGLAAIAILAPALSLPPATALAADEADAIDNIIVEEHKLEGTGLGSRSVDQEMVERMRSATNDTASLLQGIAGVSLNTAGAVSSLPSIRGLADDRLRIKVDGVDLIASCPNHMNTPLSYVDPSDVSALTVYPGIAPVSVGGDSIGGAIVADSRPAPFASDGESRSAQAELGSFYRSNNDGVGGNATASFATEAVSVRYNGSWSRSDNYTASRNFKTTEMTGRPGHTLPLDEVGSTAYETQNHALVFGWKDDNSLFQARVGYQDMPEQLFPNQRMDLLGNEQVLVNLSWRQDRQWGVFEARAWHESVDHFMDFGPDKRFWYGPESAPPIAPAVGTACSPIGFMSCAAGMPMHSESTNVGADVDLSILLDDSSILRAGAKFVQYRLDDYWPPSGGGMWPGTFLNIDDGHRDRAAIYGEWETHPGSSWLMLLGARYERVTTNAGDVQGYATEMPAPGNQIPDAMAFNATDRKQIDNNIDLTALAQYVSSESFDVEFGVARKVRTPNLYERYTWSTWVMPAIMNNFVGDGNGYVGDVNLKPEVAHTVSATLDWHAADRSWEVKATPYYTRVSDYVDAVALPGWMPDQYNVLRYANQDARLYGLDLSASVTWDNGWGKWNAAAVVAYSDGENRDTGDALYNIMPLNARLALGHQVGSWDSSVEVLLVDRKDDLSAVRNEIPTAGYALVNLRLSRSWSTVRVDIGVENLMDRFYYLPTGGAYLGQGSTMMVAMTQWGTAVPGMGRSVYAGLNLSF